MVYISTLCQNRSISACNLLCFKPLLLACKDLVPQSSGSPLVLDDHNRSCFVVKVLCIIKFVSSWVIHVYFGCTNYFCISLNLWSMHFSIWGNLLSWDGFMTSLLAIFSWDMKAMRKEKIMFNQFSYASVQFVLWVSINHNKTSLML